MTNPVTVTKNDGTKQVFEEEKLIQSLKRVHAPDEAVADIVDQIGREMHDGITTTEIYARAFELLKKHSHHAALKYSIRRAIFDLGPDGFPFEKFVARIFNVWGYEAVTDQIVMGECVSHEVDVVAWKGDELAMVEAKFHNEFGMKSDLKVALYIKARYDDLSMNVYDFGGRERKLSGRWLVTNTKFTDKAIIYGECKKLNLIGWNYPAQNSLHDIIEKYTLHPITSLTSLTSQQKKELVNRGAIICSDLVKNPQHLRDIGVHEDMIEKIIHESEAIAQLSK
ncbi:MAG: ATP cone domain-containing protein [Candidatus Paceibacterota bacterium]|jgi:hypothetical protein